MNVLGSMTVRLMAALLVILTLAAYFLFRQTHEIISEQILIRAIAYHEEIVSSGSTKLSLRVNEVALQTLALAHSADLLKMLKENGADDTTARAEQRLRAFLQQNPRYASIAIIGADFKVALNLLRKEDQIEVSNTWVETFSQGLDPFNSMAKIPVFIDTVTMPGDSMRTALRYTVPILDENNVLLGVMALDLQLDQLIRHLDVNDYGYDYFILDNEGRFLAEHNGELATTGISKSKSIRSYLSADELRALTTKRKGHFIGESLKDHLIVFSRLIPQGQTSLSTTLAQIVPLATIYAPVNYARKAIKYTTFAVFSLALIGLTYFSFQLLQPITQLAGHMRTYRPRMAPELKDAARATRRNDEVGHLYNAFIEMSEALNNSFIEVESQVKELEAKNYELEIKTEEARKLAQAKSDFLAIMSHEIRTPLNAIVGFSQLLSEEEEDDPEERAHYTMRIIQNSERLLFLIDNILDLTRIQSGRLQLLEKEFQLDELVAVIAEDGERKLNGKGIQIQLELDASSQEPLLGDPVRLRQIFDNLLNNAIKFTPKGEIKLTARVDKPENQAQDRVITFICQDSGIGIPAEKLSTIFDPFEQIDSSLQRKYEGSGLGLAICRRLCELMHGSIEVDSLPRKWSRFTVKIPLVVYPSTQDSAETKQIAEQDELESLRLEHSFLIVEDEPNNAEVLQRYLFKIGALRVDLACDLKSAHKCLKSQSYDLIFMDLHLGKQSGLDIIRSIRSGQCNLERNSQELPIIVTTAYATPEVKAECVKAGASAYFTKPLNHSELLCSAASLL